MSTEGGHMNRPPLFNGEKFDYWKDKIKAFFDTQNLDLWDIVQSGYILPTNDAGVAIPRDQWNDEQKKRYQTNQKARYILICAMTEREYDKCGKFDTAKEIWDSLVLSYEGSAQVRETKASMMVRQYELFKMEDGENIETMFGRFQTLVHGLQALGKSYTTPDHVRKILRSLSKQWRPKVTAIQEAKDLNVLRLEDLMSSLKAHELELNEEEPAKKSKSIALKVKHNKASSSKALQAEEEDSDDESSEADGDQSDDDLAFISKKIQKMWKKRNFRRKFQKKDSKDKDKKESKDKDKAQVICYECKKPGHYKSECPSLKEKSTRSSFKKKKKSLMATWEDLDSSSSEEDDEEEANLALMANTDVDSDEEVEEVIICDSYSELQHAFDDLLKDSATLSTEYNILKKKFSKLSQDFHALNKENSILKEENQKLKTENQRLVDNQHLEANKQPEAESSQAGSSAVKGNPICKSNDYEYAFQKFLAESVTRSKQASMIWGVSKTTTHGLGYISDKPPSENVSASDKANNHSDCLHCTYCNKFGHLKSACTVFSAKKDKYPSRTNKKGPKKIWVPKDKIVYVADMLSNKVNTPVLVLRQWMLASHDGRKAYVPRAKA